MNRSERRRQQKIAEKAAKNTKAVQPASRSPEQQTLSIRQAMDQALQHHAAGRLPEAERLYQRVLQADPRQPSALHYLGVIAHQEGKNNIAVDRITKAIAIAPDYTEAYINLGNALQELGKLDEAAASYAKALAIEPEFAEVHTNLGNVLQELGKLDEAAASYAKALAIKPDYAEAHNNLGVALKDLGKLDEAVASYHQALAIAPDYAEAQSNLGVALKEQGKLDEAVACYHKALAIAPDYADALYNLCEVFERTNDNEALRETVNRARRECPDDPRFALREAQLLNRDGDFTAARAVLEATGEGVADAGFLSMRTHLLGKLCDRLGDSRAAYNYFREGNRRSSETPEAKRADGRAYMARIDALAQRFTSDWVTGWRSLDNIDDRSDPVFLVGFPRSGTTLLDTILRSHRAISVVEEIDAIRDVRVALERLPGGYPDGLATLDSAHLAELRKLYFAELDKHLAPRDRSAVVIDKLPLNTVEAGLIHRIFPQARFLFVQRHPCDCVLSCFMQSFKINEAMVNFLDLEDAARLYDKVMTLWRQYRTVLPLEVHTLRYESLIVGFEETLTPLLDFLGVGWDDGVRNYAAAANRRGIIKTPSYNQVTQPLYTRARGRWEQYREQMRPALPLLLPWAKRLGYDE